MRRRTVNAAVNARQPAQRCRRRRIRASQMVCGHGRPKAARLDGPTRILPRGEIIGPAGRAEYITDRVTSRYPPRGLL